MLDFLGKAASQTDLAREAFRNRENVQFVDRVEFCHLLTSARILNRCDHPSARLRGVYDPTAGRKYFIEEEKLFELDRSY
jgi:hypothetical protein